MVDMKNHREVALAALAGAEDIENRLRAVERELGIEEKRPAPRPMDVVKYIIAETRKEIEAERLDEEARLETNG